jgi:hypothetical protein
MKNIDLSQVISTVANVGVIAGIVFLAFELRQNNELLISQARSNLVYGRATYQEYLAINAGGIAEIVTKVRQSELSDTERFQLNVHWDLVINNGASMYQVVASGPLDEADLQMSAFGRKQPPASSDFRSGECPLYPRSSNSDASIYPALRGCF